MKVPKESLEPLKVGRPPTGELRKCLLCGVEVYVRRYQKEEGIGFYCLPCGRKIAAIEKTGRCPACGARVYWDEDEKGYTCPACNRVFVDFPRVVVAVPIGAWDKIVSIEAMLRGVVAAAMEMRELTKTVEVPGPEEDAKARGGEGGLKRRHKPYKRRKIKKER